MNGTPHLNLAHRLKVALFQPQIAPNTGNIGRLCVAAGAQLHIVRPMGFVLSEREIRRSGMDYWARLNLTVHDDDAAFFSSMQDTRLWMFTSKSDRSFWTADFSPGDCLVLGSETAGLSPAVLARGTPLRIPQSEGERCLNLSTAAGIALYEAIRQLSRPRS